MFFITAPFRRILKCANNVHLLLRFSNLITRDSQKGKKVDGDPDIDSYKPAANE